MTALEHARSTAQSVGADVAGRIEWVEGDLGSWTPPPRRFDLVSCLYVHVAGSVGEMVTRHRLANRRRVRLAELAEVEMVTTPVGFGYRSLVEGLFSDAGVVPRVSFESQDLATIEGLVAAGLGVAILPEQFAGLSGTRRLTIVAPAARRTIGLVWRADRALHPPADRLRAFVVSEPST